MAILCLIVGKSGSGKSASMRNFAPGEVGIINPMGKPLPFRSSLKSAKMTDYERIKATLQRAKTPSIVIDDAGYLITDMFMTRHADAGKGNGVFSLYNDIGDKFYSLLRFAAEQVPDDKIIYLMMHEDKNDFGEIKPKTIGKLLDEKVCVEGLFTIVLRCVSDGARHYFVTQSSGLDVAKSPMGMFDELEIDNDLKMVDEKIREYYREDTENEDA